VISDVPASQVNPVVVAIEMPVEVETVTVDEPRDIDRVFVLLLDSVPQVKL
jgi:hypothetical protein